MTDDAVLLITTYGKNENGFPAETQEEIPISVVREKSATRAEFYQAYSHGIKISLILEVRPEDFELSARIVNGKKMYATKLRYDGAEYDIIRTYLDNKSLMELICN